MAKRNGERVSMVARVILFPLDLIAEVDSYAARRRAEEPGLQFTASDAVRVLIGKGLAAEEKDGKGPAGPARC